MALVSVLIIVLLRNFFLSIVLKVLKSKFNEFTDAIHRDPDPKRLNEEGDSTLELGELEQLCVNNEAETSYDVSNI